MTTAARARARGVLRAGPDQAATVDVELRAGELLYLPAGWFHEVTSYGRRNHERELLMYLDILVCYIYCDNSERNTLGDELRPAHERELLVEQCQGRAPA